MWYHTFHVTLRQGCLGPVQNDLLRSAQVDTEGRVVVDTFYITYHGDPLNKSMVQLVTNALQVRQCLSPASIFCNALLCSRLPRRCVSTNEPAAIGSHLTFHAVLPCSTTCR